MAFVPMTPPPMMPDDIEDDEIEDFGQIDDEDEDSSCYDLTGRIFCASAISRHIFNHLLLTEYRENM